MAFVLPSEKWYLSLLQSVAQHVLPLEAWLARKAGRLEAEANAAYERGDIEQAAAKYRQALDWQPSNVVYRGKLGQIYAELGRFDEAEKAFHLALVMDYEDRRSLNGLGVMLHQQGKLADAMYYYLRLIELGPKDGDVCHNLSLVFYQLGKYDDAVEWSDRAMEVAPSDPDVLQVRVKVLAAVGRLDETRAVLDRAAEISPDDPEIDLLLGWTLDLQDQPEASLKAYQEAERKDPDNAEICLQVARLSNVLGRYQEAAGASTRAASLFVGAGDNLGAGNASWELGWSYYKLGDMDASLQASTQALKAVPTLTVVYFNLGLALLHLGRVEEARTMYEDGAAKVVDVSDLKTHAIDDLQEALEKDPDLDGAAGILQDLKQQYDARSRNLASPDEPARDSVAGLIAQSAGESV